MSGKLIKVSTKTKLDRLHVNITKTEGWLSYRKQKKKKNAFKRYFHILKTQMDDC